jgi:hypothetical protein
MARIRSRAQGKAVRLTRETRQLFDWKHYVRMAPWGVLGAAALAGYLLVPARRTPSVPLSESPSPLPLPPPPVQDRGPGLLSTVVRFAVNTALRTAISYAGQAVGQYVAQLQQPLATDHRTQESEERHDARAF